MRQRGFSLPELVVVVFVFTLITGTVFGLLNVSQQRYKMEKEFLDSFQGARLALDQITRDVHTAGYPPVSSLPDCQPGVLCVSLACNNLQRIALPFAWSPNYPAGAPLSCTPGAECTVGAGCAIPGPFDLIIETDVDPENANGVEWVRYQLQGTNLLRGVVSKVGGADPAAATLAALLPYVDNVINNATPAQMNLIRTFYPTMFPGNNPVPVFGYTGDPNQPNTPQYVREVNITLIVMAPGLDPKTAQPRVATLTGLARRFNPS